MNRDIGPNTLLQIPLIEERYSRSFLASIAFHVFLVLLIIFGGFLLPRTPIKIGVGGLGGGTGEKVSTVGVVSDLSGGAGMRYPSVTPTPPSIIKKPPEDTKNAIPLDRSMGSKPQPKIPANIKENTETNRIPTANELGSGGTPGPRGSGGGIGGGNGIAIGVGSEGTGDSWYTRMVGDRISRNWIRPSEGMRVEIIYTIYIAADGTIKFERVKSSGNKQLDDMAERALNTSNPLSPPPPEFRGRPITLQFIYPTNP
jgi:hypothetical protein